MHPYPVDQFFRAMGFFMSHLIKKFQVDIKTPVLWKYNINFINSTQQLRKICQFDWYVPEAGYESDRDWLSLSVSCGPSEDLKSILGALKS